MMRIVLLPKNRWHEFRDMLPAFAGRYGGQRLTAEGIRTLRALLSSPPSDASAVIIVALNHKQLAGYALATDGGASACLVVVRDEMRGRGVGTGLMRALLHHFGSLTCNVAADNISSMKMCFRAGLVAVGLHTGPTGKATLRFESRLKS